MMSSAPRYPPQCVKSVIEKDGLSGLFGRGLQTKIISNGIQARDAARCCMHNMLVLNKQ